MSRRRQPHRIPPPISHGSEVLDAEIILAEFPDDLGLLLWTTVRAIRLRVDLGASPFAGQALATRIERLSALGLDAGLRESLEAAAEVLRGGEVDCEGVATACRLIASWAAARGATGSALEFTQAAAFLLPADAELILSVATLARRRGEFARAESWYRQAINVSRRTHDWLSLTGSYLGLGETSLQRGQHASARLALVRGIRAATRHSLWEERAHLSHELTRLAVRTERAAEAVRSGRVAYEGYGRGHPRLPRLAADLGIYWVRSGHFTEGGRLLHAIPPGRLDPEDELRRLAALARASAVRGDAPGFDHAVQAANKLMTALQGRECIEALLDLGLAAISVGRPQLAVETAERASVLASRQNDPQLRQLADELVLVARGQAPVPADRARTPSRELRTLAEELAATLTPEAA